MGYALRIPQILSNPDPNVPPAFLPTGVLADFDFNITGSHGELITGVSSNGYTLDSAISGTSKPTLDRETARIAGAKFSGNHSLADSNSGRPIFSSGSDHTIITVFTRHAVSGGYRILTGRNSPTRVLGGISNNAAITAFPSSASGSTDPQVTFTGLSTGINVVSHRLTTSESSLWVNGEKKATTIWNALPALNGAIIGCSSTGIVGFQGTLFRVSLWNRALSDSELLSAELFLRSRLQ